MFLNSVNIVFIGDVTSYRGITIAWATQIENQHIVLSLPKYSEATSLISVESKFTVSVLSNTQINIARQYGGIEQTRQADKDAVLLDFEKWHIPVVKKAAEHILCESKATLEVSNQVLILGSILEYTRFEEIPILVYEKTDYFPNN